MRKVWVFSMALVGCACLSGAVSSVSAQSAKTIAERTVLCIRKVGKTQGARDAYLTDKKCRKGYFPYALSGVEGKAGAEGAQGPQGPQGPQGEMGPGGGTIVGQLIECPTLVEPPNSQPACQESGDTFTVDIFAPGTSIFGRVLVPFSCEDEKKAQPVTINETAPGSFRLFNVPEGSYDLAVSDYQVNSVKVALSIPGVLVKEGHTTDIGTIELCYDLDKDGFDQRNDCNDENADVNPDAEEVCDGIDNNCDEAIDEGCFSSEP